MGEWWHPLVENYAYLGLFAVCLIASTWAVAFPLVPEAAVVLAAGTLGLDVSGIVLCACSGAVLAALVPYWTAHGGMRAARRLLPTAGRSRRFERYEAAFRRWGWWAIPAFVLSPVPMSSDLIGMVAGATRYPVPLFMAGRVAGEAPRVLLLALVGDTLAPLLH